MLRVMKTFTKPQSLAVPQHIHLIIEVYSSGARAVNFRQVAIPLQTFSQQTTVNNSKEVCSSVDDYKTVVLYKQRVRLTSAGLQWCALKSGRLRVRPNEGKKTKKKNEKKN